MALNVLLFTTILQTLNVKATQRNKNTMYPIHCNVLFVLSIFSNCSTEYGKQQKIKRFEKLVNILFFTFFTEQIS